jgi:hypothetical protein
MIGLAYWAETSIKVGLAAVVVPTGAAVAVYLFLFKLISFMQSRLGPMEAGPHGTLQLVAEVGKWLQKEDIIPDKADKVLFKLPPFIILATTFLMFVVIPAGPTAIVSSLPVPEEQRSDPRVVLALRGWIGFVEALSLEWAAREPDTVSLEEPLSLAMETFVTCMACVARGWQLPVDAEALRRTLLGLDPPRA